MSASLFDPERMLTVVSGLPRSGTSLMMQMLEAAGLPVASDGSRGANADNPRGFYELEAVKRLREDTSFLKDAVGRAVKIVAPLLPSIPSDYPLRVLFMERDLPEIMASQRAMLDRLGSPKAASKDDPSEAALARAYEHRLQDVKAWLDSRAGIRTCYVAHRDLLRRPDEMSIRVLDFLEETGGVVPGTRRPEARSILLGRMRAVVEPALHRSRVSAERDADRVDPGREARRRVRG